MKSNPRYKRSQELLKRATRTIPLGSQTFSKSHQQFPSGAAPLFLSHGQGGRVWDVDDNNYVDLICGLLPVVLGYRDPDVDAAIRKQLDRGICFSLATELEMELAERLVEIIPCAEGVRFGKNGSDATSGAIRLARGVTGRDRVAVCGYHGWQDWYIGSTSRDKGVPRAVSELTHRFVYNDLDDLNTLLKSHPGEFAAVIMEGINSEEPDPGYLASVKELTHQHGALFILDEVITGFRFALGGAQEMFEVTPDLACFGKSMANGMPLSAVVGRADLMAQMEEIFFSSTFGGETLSLAAAIAVVDKMKQGEVIKGLWAKGKRLAFGVQMLLDSSGLGELITLHGMSPWKLIAFHDHPQARAQAIRTLFIREMLENGILIGSSHNLCHAHDDDDLERVLKAWRNSLAVMFVELDTGKLEERLEGPVIEPVFTVRGGGGNPTAGR
ncbi:MAG: aminotransferase class III-fold pyridoxal phosphate-dependent enzyme [Magnetococcales bacterium]|nr:aminotransferase class III-fold pyridoxal phosphate-dependent enzyme [Magnetococcales bacterium]